MAKKKIALDCGHGLKTAGKQTPDGIKEWTLNDKVRDKVVENLKDYDVEFVFPDNNEGNTDEGLTARRTMYINEDVDAAVSIHHNAYTGTWNNATGVEVYVDKKATAKDRELAELIYNNMVNYLGMKGRGIKEADWTVIDQNEIPAVLTEGGFMDGIADYKIITSDEGQSKYAKAISDALIVFLKLEKDDIMLTKIMGDAVATVEQMTAYIKGKNPNVVQSVIDMIPCYLSEGKDEGVRGDIAFAQSCLETGNFTFENSAVTLNQNNFCGMGVTQNGMKGNSFDTTYLGIRAQIQHLKAYACMDELVNDCMDPRFKYVTRGCSEYVEWLGQKENPNGKGWATGAGYGDKIITILNAILEIKSITPEVEKWYRIRKSWENAESQLNAYESLDLAKEDCDNHPGYFIFDWNGEVVYPEDKTEPTPAPFEPYMVRIRVDEIYDRCLNIREKPDGGSKLMGSITEDMSVTIIEEAKDEDGYTWGLLKGYSKYKNGWIRLDYTTRV